MAIYHLNLSHGSRSGGQSAGAKLDYISREGKYAQQPDVCRLVESANLPSWANNAREFWRSADQYERANARLFSQLEFALPAELTPAGQLQLVREFAAERLEKQPYTFAIHEGKGTNPHVHLIYSERIEDGVERESKTFFKRANKKSPELGGAAKNRSLKEKTWLVETREKWADAANKALRNEASLWRKIQKTIPQIDHRTLEAQGIDREPQVHRGPERQGRIIRQYEEVMYGMGRSYSGQADQMVARRPRELNSSEVERRAHQDIERNKRLKGSNKESGGRQQKALERSLNNELQLEQTDKQVEWSTGRASELCTIGIEQITRDLAQREEHDKRVRERSERLKQIHSRSIQEARTEFERTAQEAAGGIRPGAGRTKLRHQSTLGHSGLLERQITTRYERVERERPRMGQRIERIRRTIHDGVKQLAQRITRCAAIAAKSLERHTTLLKSLASKFENLPIIKRVHRKERSTLRIPYVETNKLSYRVKNTAQLVVNPPGYKCPLKEQEKRKELEREQEKKFKFPSIRSMQKRENNRDNNQSRGIGR